jgi:hypothetical protein
MRIEEEPVWTTCPDCVEAFVFAVLHEAFEKAKQNFALRDRFADYHERGHTE